MIDEEDLRRPTPRVRLRLLKSPVVGSSEDPDAVVEHEVAGIDQWHKTATLGAAGFATYQGEHKGLPLFRKVPFTIPSIAPLSRPQAYELYDSSKMPVCWSSSRIYSLRRTTRSSHKHNKSPT